MKYCSVGEGACDVGLERQDYSPLPQPPLHHCDIGKKNMGIGTAATQRSLSLTTTSRRSIPFVKNTSVPLHKPQAASSH